MRKFSHFKSFFFHFNFFAIYFRKGKKKFDLSKAVL